MKKIITITMSIILSLALFTGCSKNSTKDDNRISDKNNSDKKKVITTIFPQYDFTRQIVGERAEVSMLLPPGAESHSYELTPQDIIKIQEADLFIYVGGGSDSWVDEILESMGEKAPKTLKLIDCVDVVEEQMVEGMEEGHEHEGHEHGEHDVEYDEHVWTSPKNAVKIVDKINHTMAEIDHKNELIYEENSKKYKNDLIDLDKSFREVIDSAKHKTIVVGDRFPFRYLVDEYKISYHAAFPGCSSNSEPSAATIAFLTDKVKSENIPAVLYIEFSNHKVADAIAESTGTKTMLLHSCHNVSKEDIKSGVSYLDLMNQNIEVLREALN